MRTVIWMWNLKCLFQSFRCSFILLLRAAIVFTCFRYKLDAERFAHGERYLRSWICQTIIRPLVAGIDKTNEILAEVSDLMTFPKIRRNANRQSIWWRRASFISSSPFKTMWFVYALLRRWILCFIPFLWFQSHFPFCGAFYTRYTSIAPCRYHFDVLLSF